MSPALADGGAGVGERAAVEVVLAAGNVHRRVARHVGRAAAAERAAAPVELAFHDEVGRARQRPELAERQTRQDDRGAARWAEVRRRVAHR